MHSPLTTRPPRKRAIPWLLAPLFATLLFVCLYVTAALLYPGGSQEDPQARGFIWAHNYWCNLLNEKAVNGQPNTARPVALASLVLMCLGLMSFWWTFPRHAPFSAGWRTVFQVSGVVSMLIGTFLITPWHDLIINVSTLLALVAMTGTFIGLYKLRWLFLFWMGLFILVLIALNNLLYYHQGLGLLHYLPIVQKISFAYVLGWISLISLRLYRQSAKHPIN